MKRFTMVMRCGDPNASAEAMMYTLIGEDYEFKRILGVKLVQAINEGKVEVTNLAVDTNGTKGLVSTNGALKNYTMIDLSGAVVGAPRAVILNRVEVNGELAGYTIYNTSGILQEVNVATAAELAKANLIANGKIRHTQQGDIVASIGGNYPLRVIEVAKAAKKDNTLKADLLFIGSALYKDETVKYGGIIVEGKSAATITKYYDRLAKENAKLIKDIKAISGVDESASLGIKITGSAGFYGVYPLELVLDLIAKSENSVGFPMGSLTVACTDYEDDKAESSVKLTKSLSVAADSVSHGNSKTDDSIKKYAKYLATKLKTCTIK